MHTFIYLNDQLVKTRRIIFSSKNVQTETIINIVHSIKHENANYAYLFD